MSGYVAISKDIKNTWVYTADDPCYFKWWFDLYSRAAYKEEDRLVGKRIVRIHKRQVMDGIGSLAKRWKAGKKKVRAFIHNLVETGMITFMSCHNVSIITIEAGFPDGFGDSQDDPTGGTTLRRPQRPSYSECCENSAYDFEDCGNDGRDYLGNYPEDHLGNYPNENVSSTYRGRYKDEMQENVSSEPHLGNHLETTSVPPSYNNKKNIYYPPTHTRTREENFSEEEFFTNVLRSNGIFVLKIKNDFCLKDDQQVYDFLSDFLSEQMSYVRVADGSSDNNLDINKRLRNYQNHFRNWLRQKLRGRYRQYNPKEAASVGGNNYNRNNNFNNNNHGFFIDPCKRDTTIIPTKGTREDFLKGFYAASE